MKLTSIAVAAAFVAAATEAKTWLFPIPQSVEWTDHIAPLHHNFKIRGAQNKHVRNAARRYLDLIYKESWTLVQVAYHNQTLSNSGSPLTSLDIFVKDNNIKLQMGLDESYSLNVPAHGGAATLAAETWVGALRGLETFSQLVVSGNGRKNLVAHTVNISDFPSFGHRGLLLDTSRNYYPTTDILRTIDGMAYNKMNVFHWHVTDSQSWPLQMISHPELADKGAYSDEEVYTPADVKRIIEYAEARGVRVLLELDMPAHTSIIHESHPDYMVCYDEFWSPYAAEPPPGQLNLIDDRAWQLVKDIVKEGTERFPDSLYHIGGDEINAACYETNQDIVKYTREHNMTTNELWFEWTNKLVDYVHNDLKKRTIVWEDPLRNGGSLPKETIVQVWTAPPQNYTVKPPPPLLSPNH